VFENVAILLSFKVGQSALGGLYKSQRSSFEIST